MRCSFRPWLLLLLFFLIQLIVVDFALALAAGGRAVPFTFSFAEHAPRTSFLRVFSFSPSFNFRVFLKGSTRQHSEMLHAKSQPLISFCFASLLACLLCRARERESEAEVDEGVSVRLTLLLSQ